MNHRGAILRWSGGLVAAALLILASLAVPVAAQERPGGEQLALDLRRNVVAIETRWADGTVHDGFGLITGTRGGETYIATADHVVRGRNPGQVSERITLQLFERQGRPVEGTLLGTRDENLDLAVVTARLPEDVGWREDVLAPDPGSLQRGAEVWFVGRGGEWYVPTRPGLVNTLRRGRHEIVVDDLPVAVGTSGAPLVFANGIVGMVVSDESVFTAHATLIDVVASTFREWGHPWALTPVGSPRERTTTVTGSREMTPEVDRAPTAVDPRTAELGLGLTATEWRQVQRALAALGHQPGPADGVPGSSTRAALRAWQRARGAEATGYLTPDEHEALLAAASAGEGVIELSGVYPEPGSVFRDCAECPELVALLGGTFLMGSPEGEAGRDADEGPQRRVRVEPFALGRYEVTRGEYGRFIAASGYRPEPGCYVWAGGSGQFDEARSWRDPGFEQTERDPVVCVSWEDARAYAGWLAEETGAGYRLPSEAEWEYAARAGTTTRFYWGDDEASACRYANGYDTVGQERYNFGWEALPCSDGAASTVAVGRYEPNRFGLHDMAGNVWEWVEDRWHDGYEGAPTDGSPWVAGTASGRVVRGGSWGNAPRVLRAALRYRLEPDNWFYNLGFRVARALTP